jgi:4-hydroxybutyrate CoA-transferase
MRRKSELRTEYEKKKLTPAAIAAQIGQGWQVVTDNSVGSPRSIKKALGKRLQTEKLFYIKVHTLLDMAHCPFYDARLTKRIGISWFSGQEAREAIARGQGDVMPCCYKDMPEFFRKYVDIDVFMVMVSPMDDHGYFSTGIVGSNSWAILKKAKRIYLEVNPQMPRIATAPLIHLSQVDALCEHNTPLAEAKEPELDRVSKKIGAIIGTQVPDGATIQLGIGAIPNGVGEALKKKHDLGIHTELLTDKMLELIECGAVTNQLKPIHCGKTVATFAYGSRKLYDFLDENPSVEILPVDYVNNPGIIAKMPNFISVNSALQVDFWGQVCAESIGTYHVSGTGGQLDYVRGAVMSPGGRSFIAFPSTARSGTVSRIAATLDRGAVVTTGKNEVDCIVTEYGIASLRGKTWSERTRALIAIAHPKFRQELYLAAQKMKIL